MKVSYELEVDRLDDVYKVALEEDVSQLVSFVEKCLDRPLLTVGSGGSFTSAKFAAWLHRRFTDRMAMAAYPLEVIRNQTMEHGTLYFSAQGSNKDILCSFQHSVDIGTSPLSALVMSKDSPLEVLAEKYTNSKPICYSNQQYRDGFLAVATIMASSVLLLRAYTIATKFDLKFPDSLAKLLDMTLPSFELVVENCSEAVADKKFVSVLHSEGFAPVAVDLESRFTEAALGAIHTSDFRNFGHGRHYWFVRHCSDTGIVAFVSAEDKNLADRTLELIPSNEVLRLDFRGPIELASVTAIVAGLFLTARIGRRRGIDPNLVSVPEFGRKLYSLGPMLT